MSTEPKAPEQDPVAAKPKPPEQDPALAPFWEQRFRTGLTPWDAGRTPVALQAFATTYAGRRRILIPGCGSGWEVRYLAERGWEVTAVDFSATAIALARANLGPYAARVLHADFFAFDPGAPFPVMYERTFLCALPRKLWPKYVARTASLLQPGGLLAGFFFFSEEPKGPPFGATPEALSQLLEPWFTRTQDGPVDDSLPLFRGRERWQTWTRNERRASPP